MASLKVKKTYKRVPVCASSLIFSTNSPSSLVSTCNSPSSPTADTLSPSSRQSTPPPGVRDHLRLIAFHPLLVRSLGGLGRGAYSYFPAPSSRVNYSPRVSLFRALPAALSRSGMRAAADELLAWEALTDSLSSACVLGSITARYLLRPLSIIRDVCGGWFDAHALLSSSPHASASHSWKNLCPILF